MFTFIRQQRKRARLCRAISDGEFDLIQKFVGEGMDLNFVLGHSSPLSKAIWCADRKIVDFLMAHGASLSRPGNESCLIGAARKGDHELIDLALAAGHDIHFRPADTPTALQIAAFENKPETMKYLIAKGAAKEDFDVQTCVWRSLRAPTIEILLELGVDVPGDAA